jgi:hypothetical protein
MTLALVHLRQGQPDAAKPCLAKVDAWLATHSRESPTHSETIPTEPDWQNWLQIRLLRREARDR